jgi:hypothetical protein
MAGMSFDKPTRNALANMVGECRRLLTEDVRHQLQATYGLQPDGTALPVSSLGHLDERRQKIARELREWQEHLASTEVGTEAEKKKAAFDRLAHETAFTVLNRLAALRMGEERGHVIECVRRGMESDGFVLYERFSGGVLGTRGETYQVFLERMFDELAVDLGALFDLRAPQSLVFPRERCLEEVLALLNDVKLAHLWKEDETIGWVYQYFNSREERERMREESAAPRNSRELAVRNQFFTPRYVVEFLVDNTLGRIWYEMGKGETALKDHCRYLVRRPTEVFLRHGEEPATPAEPQENPSQEELLKQPVYISHRPKKDPRDLKILDPACGSGHFLLYCFDLLETIYEEAWADEQAVPSEVTGKSLRVEFPTLESLRKALPELILRHNLHGIDVDLRACQIAALALWLRAQRTYQRHGLKGMDRPKITKSNIVCAEPMPGEKAFLEQFLARLEPKVIGQLVQVVFEKMKLAGEAGSLLKIEEEIADTVALAKKQWLARPKAEQTRLFADDERPEQKELGLDFSGITDEAFWEKAEERIYAALQAYAEQVENGRGYQRRLFADDAARGFAFIDLCRKRYDVILMNPPFGDPTKASKGYIDDHFEHSSGDILHAFVDRGLRWLSHRGREGVISARTGFFLGDSKNWRVHVVFANRLVCFADLGLGVLDDALVEVATYVIEHGNPNGNRIYTNRQLDTRQKGEALLKAIGATAGGAPDAFGFFDQSLLKLIPDHTFAYWAPASLLRRYSDASGFGTLVGRVRQGVATADDFRFARLGWEVGNARIGPGKRWQRFSKGGEYSPSYDDIHLVLDWLDSGAQLAVSPTARFQNLGSMFKPGATYSARTASALAAKVLPAGCVFSHMAQTWFCTSPGVTLLSIGYLSSRVPQAFLELAVGSGDIATAGSAARRYTTAVVESVPAGPIAKINATDGIESVRKLYYFRLALLMADETSCHFTSFHLIPQSESVRQAVRCQNIRFLVAATEALCESGRLDQAVCEAFKLTDDERRFVDAEVGVHPASYAGDADALEVRRLFHLPLDELMAEAVARHGAKRWFTKKSYFVDRRLEIICHHLQISPPAIEGRLKDQELLWGSEEFARNVFSETLGTGLGRWDIRFALGEKSAPELLDPFASLPACPPGMLQNEQGLPLTEDDVRRFEATGQWNYPIEVPWDGILVDDPEKTNDIVRRVRKVLEVVWKDRAEAIEEEGCEILGVKDLREYFRKPALFFADHLKRYSKSRRQAPIYWPLSTTSGSYTLWIYYHRLNDQTLYTALNKYVKPKIDDVEKELRRIEFELPTATGREASKLREAFEDCNIFLEELRELRDELQRVAGLPYKPNLNDGVLITASPLWKLFRFPKWRKDLEACWKELEAGDYDWAHLAYSIWPDRVREVCKGDRSVAIAHGLEGLCQVPQKPSKGKRSRKQTQDVEERDLGDEE